MSSRMSKLHTWLIIISLLSLNIVEQAASVITGTIPGMAKFFSDESLVNIEMITTVVSIFVTIFVLVSGAVVKLIGRKNTAVVGLFIAMVTSIVPAISSDFATIIISRALLGVGIGLANPLAISLIGVFFDGDKRASLMGWRSAIAGIGTAFMTFAAGKLLVFGWHSAYLVYLLFVPTLIIFTLFVPNPDQYTHDERTDFNDLQADTISEHNNNNNSILLIGSLAVLIFLVMTALMIVAVKLPTYFVNNKIGSATQASTAWSIINFATVLGGFMFGPIYKRFKDFVLPAGLILGGIGIVVISVTQTIGEVYSTCVLTGISSSMIIPFIFNKISESSTQDRTPFYTSIALVGSNLGSFLSPYGGLLLGSMAQKAIRNAGFIEILLAFITLICILVLKKAKIFRNC